MIKNIIIVNDFDYVQGGASKVAIQTANMLVKLKNDINVYFFSAVHSEESTLAKEVIKICTNQTESMKNKNKIQGIIDGLYNFKSKKKLKELLKNLNNDETIIHVHGWTKSLSSSIFEVAFKMNFKVVLTMHDYFTACPNGGYFNYEKNEICHLKPLSWKCIKCNCDSRNYRFKLYRVIRQFIQNKIVKLNDKLSDVISISEFSENILKETLNPKIKIHRVYNPIDLDNHVEKIDYTQNEYFLYVGRISKEKGVDIFCEAITRSKLKGIVVGDGDERKKLEKEYPNITFTGWKNSNEVREYMKNAKALVFPSRWYETAGLTALEAQKLQIPVIISNNTSTEEFALDKKFIFENGNIEMLSEKMLNISEYHFIKFNEKKYSDENYINGVIEVYGDIL